MYGDDFATMGDIILNPGDANVVRKFEFTQDTAERNSDGYLAYDDDIYDIISVIAKKLSDGTDVSDDIIRGLPALDSENDNVVIVTLDYPSANGADFYELEFIVVTESGEYRNASFKRIEAIS